LWTASDNVELANGHAYFGIYSNRSLNGLKISATYEAWDGGRNDSLELNGHSFSIGEVGIINASLEQVLIRSGRLTSHTGLIKIQNTEDTHNEFIIEAAIVDSVSGSVGLSIEDVPQRKTKRAIALTTSSSNTFTGDATVAGNNILRLRKQNGAIAISGNLNIKDGAAVELYERNQINRNARVTLRSYAVNPSEIVFKGNAVRNLSETIHQLVVEGTGKIDFGDDFNHGSRYFYLDDLEIKAGSRLIIQNWQEGRDFLLVRKDSEHLHDSLNKVEFQGYGNGRKLVDFNHEYYAIYTPEPTTFGAGLALAGLGVLGLRRKSRLKLRPRCTNFFD